MRKRMRKRIGKRMKRKEFIRRISQENEPLTGSDL